MLPLLAFALRVVRFPALVVCAAFFLGCAPKIGDSCSVSTDCSVNGDRLCDTTQPGGYCTVFNCQPDSCPGNSVCVAFRDSSCGEVSGRAVRFQRTFCMASCDSNGDCRAGYTCRDVGVQIVDTNPSNGNVCAVAVSSQEPVLEAGVDAETPPICSPFDGSFSSGSTGGEDASTGGGPSSPDSSNPDSQGADSPNTDSQGSDSDGGDETTSSIDGGGPDAAE
jgi:hypothetical protein